MNIKKMIAIGLATITFICGIRMEGFTSHATEESSNRKHVEIVFQHDMHSYLDGYSITEDGKRKEIGGVARLSTYLKEKRIKNPDILLVDAGDMVMGTLFQTVAENQAVELRMLGRLGFDATTFGNHEFDYGAPFLASMLTAAKRTEKKLPAIVACNIDWDKNNDYTKTLRPAIEEYGVKNYTIVEKGAVRIAILGYDGEVSIEDSPSCELKFLDGVKAVKQTVEDIKLNENVDMIVCLAHAGTNKDPKKSEDEILAKEVPGLDVIISGHTHTSLEEPIVVGDTYICSAGNYLTRIGEASFTQNSTGRWSIDSYKLVNLDDRIAEDPEYVEALSVFDAVIEQNYLKNFGYRSGQVLVQNNIDFGTEQKLYNEHVEHPLGNIIADSYRYVLNQLPTAREHVFDVTIAPAGVVRSGYAVGDVTVEDVFRSFSLGRGKDGIIGYPLVSMYLTGKELKMVCELDASISDGMKSARLYMSGLNYTYNPHRIILNKAYDFFLEDDIMYGDTVDLDGDKMYRVATDLYTCTMLKVAKSKSFGLISIEPKDENGEEIEDFDDFIIHDEEGNEVKAWAAIAQYMEHFGGPEGKGFIPDYYLKPVGRKIVSNTFNPFVLFSELNKYSVVIILIVLAILGLLTLLVFKIRKKIRNYKEKKALDKDAVIESEYVELEIVEDEQEPKKVKGKKPFKALEDKKDKSSKDEISD